MQLHSEHLHRRNPQCGVTLLFIVASLFLLVALPVVVRGAPLRDDFDVCLSPRWTSGAERMLAELWPEWGAVRLLGRFIEQSIIGDLCGAVPFGAIIAIPLLTTFAVAFVLRGLLYDLEIPKPWPEIGTALWFLQPLGTEASLWPVALHIPLGLLLALVALRLYRHGRVAPAAVSSLAACWNLEQVLFALPLAVWVITPARHRRRAIVVSSVVFLVLLTIFMRWPGGSTRTAVPLTDRILAIVTDPLWYVQYPAIGTGAVSIPLAVRWAFPWSVLVLAVGSLLGVRYAPVLIPAPEFRRWAERRAPPPCPCLRGPRGARQPADDADASARAWSPRLHSCMAAAGVVHRGRRFADRVAPSASRGCAGWVVRGWCTTVTHFQRLGATRNRRLHRVGIPLDLVHGFVKAIASSSVTCPVLRSARPRMAHLRFMISTRFGRQRVLSSTTRAVAYTWTVLVSTGTRTARTCCRPTWW